MSKKLPHIRWLTLLGDNGWQWQSADSDYNYYTSTIYGNSYFVNCWAVVSENEKGYQACGDYGVAWIECDLSEYTSRERHGRDDATEIMLAIEHAEENLLRCGVPFTAYYKFSGKNRPNKRRRNNALRKKLGIIEDPDEAPEE